MANSYENVPVFRSRGNYDDPFSVVGKANVEVDEENNKATITIETVGEEMVEFLALGTLKAFEINTVVQGVDPEKAEEFWSRQQ